MAMVEVIVPARNAEASLPATLESIRSQSFQDWHVTITDDASEDRTSLVAAEFGPRFAVIRSDKPLGPAGARNYSLEAAELADSEFIAFLDSDDLWDPEYLASQLEAFERCRLAGREVGLVACDARIRAGGLLQKKTWLEQGAVPRDITLEQMLRRNSVFVSALVPLPVLKEVGYFDEHLWGTEDYDLWLRILEAGYEVCLNERVLVTYVDNAGSVSSDTGRQSRNTVAALVKALQRGKLSRREREQAQASIRLHEAQALVSDLLRGQARLSSIASPVNLRLLLWVALAHPGLWVDWTCAATRIGSQRVTKRVQAKKASEPTQTG